MCWRLIDDGSELTISRAMSFVPVEFEVLELLQPLRGIRRAHTFRVGEHLPIQNAAIITALVIKFLSEE